MIPIPAVSLRTIVEITLGLVLVLFGAAQTVRVEGLNIWPIHIEGYKAKLASAQALTRTTQAAFDKTVSDYRHAAELQAARERENLARVQAESTANAKEAENEYQTRIAAARATAARLRAQLESKVNSSSDSDIPVSGVSASATGTTKESEAGGFSIDERLTATEQAIQLDALTKWVIRQHNIKVNPSAKNMGAGENVVEPSITP